MPRTVYTASFFQPENHHGRIVSIARRKPKGIECDSLAFLAPNQSLLQRWQSSDKQAEAQREYVKLYSLQLKRSKAKEKLEEWIFDGDEVVTFCCWERKGQFCHRNNVFAAIAHYWPELAGGKDVAAESPYRIWSDGKEERLVTLGPKREDWVKGRGDDYFVVYWADGPYQGSYFHASPEQLQATDRVPSSDLY